MNATLAMALTAALMLAAGGAMGGAIVGGIIASSQGNLNFFRQQPATEELRKALRAD